MELIWGMGRRRVLVLSSLYQAPWLWRRRRLFRWLRLLLRRLTR